ncbi:hypothetical protein [Malacoplasma muris]|uniref:hypothetical protein n=1 Tax=Malacoplasma muris TaxID=2119 RepID=UPI00398F5008
MKKLLTKNRIKYITIVCFSALVIGSIFGIASIFLNENNSSNNYYDNSEYDEFIFISIENEIKQQNLNSLLEDSNVQKFSQNKIRNNIMRISRNSIDNSNDFKSENINDYEIRLRYFLNDEFNDLKINIFMYNKLIKNKKFKTFYRLYII